MMGTGAIKRQVWISYGLNFVCLAGLAISAYSLLLEMQMDDDAHFKPFCDISAYVSCSKPLQSRWGKGLGQIGPVFGEDHWLNQRNPVYGMLTYSLLLALLISESQLSAKVFLWIAVLCNLASVYLAFILFVKIQAFCILCVTMYVINIVILVLGICRSNNISALEKRKRA